MLLYQELLKILWSYSRRIGYSMSSKFIIGLELL